MKRVLFIIFAVFLCVSQADSMMLITGRPRAAAPTCETQQMDTNDTPEDVADVAKTSDKLYLATKFVYSGTNGKAICLIKLPLKKTGTPTNSLYAVISDDDGASPSKPDGTSILGTSDAVDASTLTTSKASYDFTFSTPTSPLSNGTTYWVWLYGDSYHATNYVLWYLTTTGTTKSVYKSGDGSSWSYVALSYTMEFQLFSQ